MRNERIFTVVADIQVGHFAALWPDNFTFGNGISVKLAPHQEVLLEYWHKFWTDPRAKDSDSVINLAESIEGKNRKEYGANLVTPMIDVQCDAIVALFRPYIKNKNYHCVKGSGYHDSEDTVVDYRIAKELCGTYHGDIMNLRIKGTGHILWATHKAGNAMLYRSTMLDRNSLYCSAMKGDDFPDPDVILYGHHHKYFRVDTESRINAIAPSWKFWHPIKGAAAFFHTQPTIGGLFVRFPKNGGEVKVEIKRFPIMHLYSALTEA